MNHRRPFPNRRNAFRLSVNTGKNRVEVIHEHGRPRLELIDLSATGGRMLYRSSGPEELALPKHLPVELRLPNGEHVATEARVVRHGSPQEGVLHVGARWSSLDDDSRLKLQRFITCARIRDDARTVTVKNPMFIRNLLAQRPNSPPPHLSIIDRDLRLGSQLRVESVAFQDGRRVIRARLLGDAPFTLCKESSYEFVLGGTAVTVFESSCLGQQGRDVTLTLPAEVSQKSGRDSRRTTMSGLSAVTTSFFLPGCRSDGLVKGALVNVSGRGVCFQFHKPNHGLLVGDEIASFDIELPTRRLTARAVVRTLVNEGPAGSFTCGVELVRFSDDEEAAAWRRYVFDHLHPNLLDGRGRAGRSWQVLEASKYVDLWTAADTRDAIRAEYQEAWQTAAPEVGHSLLLCRRDVSVGVIAASVVYPGSWILHHLGRDNGDDGKNQAGLKESSDLLCGIMERLKAETNFEHFLIYFERDKRFNEGLYVDFAERYFDKSKLLISSNEVFRRSSAAPLPEEPSGGVDVVPAKPALLDLLAKRLASTTTPLERKAMALDEARLALTEFEQTCAGLNYQRQRAIFFALEEGQPRAALIAEVGSEGVNIFGLLNTCRIVSLTDVPPSLEVRTALLSCATSHYRRASKKNFLFLDEPGPTDGVPASLGFEHVSGGLRWIAHRDVVPAWSAYLEGLLAAAPAQKGTVRPPIRASLPHLSHQPSQLIACRGIEQ